MKLPMRFRILHLISEKENMGVDEVMEALRPEYGGERQWKRGVIYDHLRALKAVGMIETTDVSLDEKGNLVEKFKITDYGKSRLRYLPEGWSN
ncbi:MAG: Winged-helix DNA-binding domain protein [Thermoanaerobacterales bacterium 50_218]|nr:MAG: Winged-helix DNA-binding domain protein [Thermoanaerobacterales bacterium 50_218]